MPLSQVRVQAPPTVSAIDGNYYDQLGGKQQEGVVSQLHGNYYTQAGRGNLFISTTTPLGIAVPIYTTGTPNNMLWNPGGNSKNAVLIRYIAAYVSGTTVAGAVGLSKIFDTGSAVSGSIISAFTPTTPFNGLLNAGNTSTMRVSAGGPVTIAVAVAADFFYTIYHQYAAIATSAITPVMVTHDFDGAVVVPPNVAIFVSGSAASGALIAQTLIWEEVPV